MITYEPVHPELVDRVKRLAKAHGMLRAMGGKGKLRLHLLRGYGCMLAVQ